MPTALWQPSSEEKEKKLKNKKQEVIDNDARSLRKVFDVYIIYSI